MESCNLDASTMVDLALHQQPDGCLHQASSALKWSRHLLTQRVAVCWSVSAEREQRVERDAAPARDSFISRYGLL
jgi:hypothetical protein